MSLSNLCTTVKLEGEFTAREAVEAVSAALVGNTYTYSNDDRRYTGTITVVAKQVAAAPELADLPF